MNTNNEDAILKHIEDTENVPNNDVQGFNQSQVRVVDYIEPLKRKSDNDNNTNYINIDINLLPGGRYYDNNTSIFIRPATVGEIQAYSIIDNNNVLDVLSKIYDIISKCVKIKINDKDVSYKNILEMDKIVLLSLISKYTKQNAKKLTIPMVCNCGENFNTEFDIHTYTSFELPIEIEECFDYDTKKFIFQLESDDVIEMKPPTIGLSKDIMTIFDSKKQSEKEINKSFFSLVSWLLCGYSSVTQKDLDIILKTFNQYDVDTFSFVHSVINEHLNKLGIEFIKGKCPACGEEVHNKFRFPGKTAKSYFIDEAIYSKLVKK